MDRRMAAGKTCFLMRAKQAEGPMKKLKMALVLILLSVVFINSSALAAEFTDNSANINNTFLPAKIGFSFLKTGYGDRSFQYEYGNIFGTDIVDGVKCVKVIIIRTESSEFTQAWLAQDVNGSVYLLKYWDGSESAPVVLGKNNAAVFMPSSPKVGDKIFGGDATVTAVGVTVAKLTTGLGPFADCLKATETDGDIIYIAPQFGEVKKVYSSNSGWELKEIYNAKKGVIVVPIFE